MAAQEANGLFDEVAKMPEKFPDQCLDDEVLWSDQSEKANGIIRHAPYEVLTQKPY